MTIDEWKRELLTERIRDLNSVPFTIKGNDFRNYGAPNAKVEDMIKAANHLEAEEMDRCERVCELAERAQIVGIGKLAHG